MIQTEALRKSYAARPVLRGVSVEVGRGEVFGFIGPNGAGKSTFLKCLLGVVRPDGGSALVAGVDAIADPIEARRRVGYAPGEIALYDRMRVGQLLDFATSFHARRDLDWAVARLEALGVPLDRRVGKLSHGMKRKLLLVQALSVETPVVLLDEPMEGLDPEARRRVEQLLLEQAAGGRTVFFSSHDLDSVERVCDRVAFLRGGELLEVGAVQELLDRASRILSLRMSRELREDELPQAEGFLWQGAGTRWKLQYRGELRQALRHLEDLPLEGIRDASGGLAEVFDVLYGPNGEVPPRQSA